MFYYQTSANKSGETWDRNDSENQLTLSEEKGRKKGQDEEKETRKKEKKRKKQETKSKKREIQEGQKEKGEKYWS